MAILFRCDHCNHALPDSGIVEAVPHGDDETEHYCDVECFGKRCVEYEGASYASVKLVTVFTLVQHWLDNERGQQ